MNGHYNDQEHFKFFFFVWSSKKKCFFNHVRKYYIVQYVFLAYLSFYKYKKNAV